MMQSITATFFWSLHTSLVGKIGPTNLITRNWSMLKKTLQHFRIIVMNGLDNPIYNKCYFLKPAYQSLLGKMSISFIQSYYVILILFFRKFSEKSLPQNKFILVLSLALAGTKRIGLLLAGNANRKQHSNVKFMHKEFGYILGMLLRRRPDSSLYSKCNTWLYCFTCILLPCGLKCKKAKDIKNYNERANWLRTMANQENILRDSWN